MSVEVVAPVLVGGDQDLRPARSVDEHRRVAGVFVDDVLAAVDHGEVGRPDDLVGPAMVGGQIDGVVPGEIRTRATH